MYRFYKSKIQEDIDNNELHEAILQRDIDKCMEIIQSPDTNKKMLNQLSLGNTPAMLALKTGLVDVAYALIEKEDVNIHLPDMRGFSLLHYACFLREEHLITALLNRDARCYQVDEISEWPPKELLLRKSLVRMTNPFYLYKLAQSCKDYPREIVDSDGFCILPLVLTDLLFHVDKLCLNYCIKQENDFTEANEIPMSSLRFSKYSEIGLEEFLTMRNEKPANEDILLVLQEKMNSSHNKPSHLTR